MDKLSFDQFSIRYCERQESTPAKLLDTLKRQKEKYHPDGWFLLEAQDMQSSWLGSLTILPYGPNNTYKQIPDRPVSPRGLASDTSVVVAYTLASELPDQPPDWIPPPAPQGKHRGRNKKVR